MRLDALKSIFAVCVTLLLTPAASATPTAVSGIGYASVSAARQALAAKPAARTEEHSGWTIVTDAQGDGFTTWSFAPKSHASYPSVVRRDIVLKNGNPTLVMRVLCEARRGACDSLYTRMQARVAHCTSNCTTVLP